MCASSPYFENFVDLLIFLQWVSTHSHSTMFLKYDRLLLNTTNTPGSALSARGLHYQQVAFKKRKRDYISRVHQPMPMLVRGTGEKCGSGNYCRYKKCPGLNNKKKTTRAYRTIYQCEECTVEKKQPFWLCHTSKKINGKDTVVSCHLKYHAQKEFLKATSSTECSLVSDLTEEETNPPNNDISSV
jgi:hypothetical protein